MCSTANKSGIMILCLCRLSLPPVCRINPQQLTFILLHYVMTSLFNSVRHSSLFCCKVGLLLCLFSLRTIKNSQRSLVKLTQLYSTCHCI